MKASNPAFKVEYKVNQGSGTLLAIDTTLTTVPAPCDKELPLTAARFRTKMERMTCTVADFQYWPILIPDFRLLNASGLHAPLTPRIITHCRLSDGSEGWGEVPCNSGVIRVLQLLAPQLKGTNTTVEAAQQTLAQIATESRRLSAGRDERGTATFDRGVTNHVRAGVQMALYAAMAQHQNLPLCDLLGGEQGRQRDQVRFNMYLFFLADTAGSGLDYSHLKPSAPNTEFQKLRETAILDGPSAARFALAGIASLMPGVQLVKWKLGALDPEAELEAMLAVAQAIGPAVQLIPDPNAAWDNPTAISFIRRLKDAIGDQLPYFEDPVAGIDNMAIVHRETGVPLATNMCAANFEQHEEAVRKNAIQITLGGDCHYIGGSDEAVRLSRWCTPNGIGFAQHSNTHLGISHAHTVHMGAAADTHHWPFDSHYFPWQADYDPIVRNPILPEHGGLCRVPDRPGLGVDISMDGVNQLHELYLQANSHGRSYQNRDDGPPADLAYGGWVRPQNRPQKWFTAGVQQPG